MEDPVAGYGYVSRMVQTVSSARAAEAAVTYREQAPPTVLAPWVRCLWRLTVQGGDGPGRVVPDGFMDLVAAGSALHLAGPDTRPWPVERRGGETVVGVRFHPGAAPPLIGPPASELRDTQVAPGAIWGRAGRELAERVEDAPSPGARMAAMLAALTGRLDHAAPPDPLVAAAVARLELDPGAVRVGALGPDLGLGERQLRRRFLAGVGYGPKTLARVMRFQRLLAMLQAAPSGPRSLAEAAATAGYADQAHMTAECTALAGRSPAALLGLR